MNSEIKPYSLKEDRITRLETEADYYDYIANALIDKVGDLWKEYEKDKSLGAYYLFFKQRMDEAKGTAKMLRIDANLIKNSPEDGYDF